MPEDTPRLRCFPHGVLALGMLTAGSLNTIAYKVADDQTAEGLYSWQDCNWTLATADSPPPSPPAAPLPPLEPLASPPPSPPPCLFIHPFFQVYAMFLGECLCLLAFFALRCSGKAEPAATFNPFVFLPCALCDTLGTSLMMIGLLLTFASSYQMLRGSVVIFTGIFSRVFLKRRLNGSNWTGLVLVLAGTAVVGLAPAEASAGASNPALGNLLIVGAQVVVAVQMICEEFFVGDRDIPPLLAVGLEGVFGVLVLTVIMVVAYNVPGIEGLSMTPDRLDDGLDALHQVFAGGNALLTTSMVAVCLSIAFFNFFGISVTKQLSAAHRMVLDSSRSIVVWIFSMATGEGFSYIKLIGFLILVLGSLVYYEILPLPLPASMRKPRDATSAVHSSTGSTLDGPLDASLISRGTVQSDAANTA